MTDLLVVARANGRGEKDLYLKIPRDVAQFHRILPGDNVVLADAHSSAFGSTTLAYKLARGPLSRQIPIGSNSPRPRGRPRKTPASTEEV